MDGQLSFATLDYAAKKNRKRSRHENATDKSGSYLTSSLNSRPSVVRR